jgi:hypothetical protein
MGTCLAALQFAGWQDDCAARVRSASADAKELHRIAVHPLSSVVVPESA